MTVCKQPRQATRVPASHTHHDFFSDPVGFASVRAIYVDCDGTLLTLDCSYGDLFDAACEPVGVDPTPEIQAAYSEHFFDAFADFHPNPYRAGMAAAVEAGDVNVDPDALAAAYIDAEVEASTQIGRAHV